MRFTQAKQSLRRHRALAAVVLCVVTAACASQPKLPRFLENDPPGFFSAVVHGLLAPFALLVSVFSNARIYAYPNTGFSYDLGYIFGVFCWVFVLALLLRRRGKSTDHSTAV